MAPFDSIDYEFDLTDLSPKNRAIFLRGVSGGDGDDAPAEAAGGDDAEQHAEAVEGGDAPKAEGGDAPAEGEGEGIEVPTLPDDLASVSVEDLQSLHAQMGEARESLRGDAKSQDDIERIRQIGAQRNKIADEMQRRIDESNAVREGLAELDDELAQERGLPEPEMALASMTPANPSASQIAKARGAQSKAAQEPPAPEVPRPRVPLLAAISGGNSPVGSPMSINDFGAALDRTKRGTARTVVASLASYDETPDLGIEVLGRGSAEHNSALMRETREAFKARQRGETLDARVAAICDPLDIIRDIPDAFNVAEPFRGIFPSRPIGRLGFQFIQSVGLANVAGSTGLWSDTEQALVDPTDQDTWKDCLQVDCPTPTSVTAEAVTACLTWDITTEMSNPEHVANLMNALNALRARTKEARILQLADALSSAYTYVGGGYGAVPTLIAAINTAIAQATYTDRLDDPNYTVVLPPGLVQVLAIDEAGRAYNSDTVTDVLRYVTDRCDGVRSVVSTLDASASGTEPSLPFQALNTPGAAAVALPSLDDGSGQHRIRIIDPSAAIYGETGDMNMGTTADSQLLRQNRTQYFVEEFLLLTKQGPEPWFSIDVTLCPDGSRAGLIEPFGCIS